MTDAGYVLGGWTVSAVAIAGYVAHLVRRRRALEGRARSMSGQDTPWQ